MKRKWFRSNWLRFLRYGLGLLIAGVICWGLVILYKAGNWLGISALATELDVVQTAMDMENRTYDFYKSQGKNANYDTERDFYEALAVEEKEHHLILLDYYEYLKDPAGWFVSKEHPSLDGG